MEWQQFQKEQEMIHTKLRRYKRLSEQQLLLKRQISLAEKEILEYSTVINKLRQRLAKLEGFSFMNMLRTWTGQQDELRSEKIDKAAVMELKMNEAMKMKLDLSKDLRQVSENLANINEAKLRAELATLDTKKKKYLQLHEPEQAQKLEQLTHEEILSKQLINDIDEAKKAGEIALSALGQASASLHSAGSYSTWDTFFGGGLLATHLKHGTLDKSENYLHNAQISLQRFHNELIDIQNLSTNSLHLETEGFVKFADYFFDDIFSAWSVHSKISTAKEQVSRVQDDVHNTIWRLQEKRKNAESHLSKLTLEKQLILQI